MSPFRHPAPAPARRPLRLAVLAVLAVLVAVAVLAAAPAARAQPDSESSFAGRDLPSGAPQAGQGAPEVAGQAATPAAAPAPRPYDPDAPIRLGPDAALLVVDMQNCFVEGGTLPVAGGRAIVPLINQLGGVFDNVVLTQDWHPVNHVSFASTHDGRSAYDTIRLPYGQQVLWPDHCVQGTRDADFVGGLELPHAQLIVRKGFHRDVDSYSAFIEADRRTPTGLDGYLKQRRIRRLFIVGLATDFCVAWTALDARSRGYQAWVVEDATRAIDRDGSLAQAWKKMKDMGVRRIGSSKLVPTP